MFRRLLWLVPIAVLGACSSQPGPVSSSDVVPTSDFVPTMNADLKPGQASTPDRDGTLREIASSRDADGVVSDFIVGVVRLRKATDADLQTFLSRYGGTVIADDAIPAPPEGSGITLTAEQRKPTEYVVSIDVSKVDASTLAANGAADGLTGKLEISSDDGMRTLAAVKEAKSLGFHASADYMTYPLADRSTLLFQTAEGLASDGSRIDALTLPVFATTGCQSNVALALRYLTAHGIQRRVTVAVIDDGFWLDAAGQARTKDGAGAPVDTDFPVPPAVIRQHNFLANTDIADGPVWACYLPDLPPFFGPPFGCWHGTGTAAIATGIIGNDAGWAGTGGLVADPMLLKMGGSHSEIRTAIRYAVAMGADVVSISWGGDCNRSCRVDDREDTPIDDAIAGGSKTVFVAAAGNDNHNVSSPHFFHPCTLDHMICVGALADNATTKIDYSNFGARVDLFAPTDIPVMAFPGDSPDPNSAVKPTFFDGTSASAPFVAGVAAMMKAINPDLNSDQVGAMLRETAHPGDGDVTRYIDAYAALRRAALGGPTVRDRFENNDLESRPADLGSANPQNYFDLNLDASNDVDYYRIESPGPSIMGIDVLYMQELGFISLIAPQGLGTCGPPVYSSDDGLAGLGHHFEYKVSGGPLEFGLKSDNVNGYDLSISFTAAAVAADGYEPNDSVPAAKYIHSFKPAQAHSRAVKASVTIDASIDSATDVDYYIVRGEKMTLAQQVLLSGFPSVEVYGNESASTLDVWKRNPDGTQGDLVGTVSGTSCTAQALSVRLDEDQFYLVRVAGGVGRYTLRNGLDTKKRDIAVLSQDPLYVILNPGDPIEHELDIAERFVFVADSAFSQVRVAGQLIHLQLLDAAANVIGEGVLNDQGEILSLAGTVANQVYALEASPKDSTAAPPMLRLEWDAAAPARISGNLIANAGAETVVGPHPAQDVPFWDALQGTPRVFFYDDQSPTTNPSFAGPGPTDRGDHLFAGGPNNTLSQLRQTINIDPAWQQAINDGHVQFDFSAFLGGLLGEPDHTDASLTFLDANFQTLGQQSLPSVTTLDRDAKTGLFPVEAIDYLPVGTAFVYVNLVFQGGVGDYNDGYADNLELILSDYTPSP